MSSLPQLLDALKHEISDTLPSDFRTDIDEVGAKPPSLLVVAKGKYENTVATIGIDGDNITVYEPRCHHTFARRSVTISLTDPNSIETIKEIVAENICEYLKQVKTHQIEAVAVIVFMVSMIGGFGLLAMVTLFNIFAS